MLIKHHHLSDLRDVDAGDPNGPNSTMGNLVRM